MGAKERQVLSWFTQLTSELAEFAEGHPLIPKAVPKALNKAQLAYTAFRGETKARYWLHGRSESGEDSKSHWSQILALGELKSNLFADTASKQTVGPVFLVILLRWSWCIQP